MPKSSDWSFVDELIDDFGKKNHKQFKSNKFRSCFISNHYAGPNPVSHQIFGLFPDSSNAFICGLDSVENSSTNSKLKMVMQKHKEQLSVIMKQLSSTEPHFVRCILLNLDKVPNTIDKDIMSNQLRCNGNV